MALNTISILDGNEFVVCDARGDLESTPTDTHGLFRDDTRFLSRWILTINGLRPQVLSTDDLTYFQVRFFLALATGSVYVNSQLSAQRTRSIGHSGFREEITLTNHAHEPVVLAVRIEAAADFADLFEVKDNLEKKGQLSHRVENGHLRLCYQRDSFRRETLIRSSQPAQIEEQALSYKVTLPAHGQWTTYLEVRAINLSRPADTKRIQDEISRPVSTHRVHQDLEEDLNRWIARAPKLNSSSSSLEQTYRRSLVDLAALRFHNQVIPGVMPAAGLPWFMTIFGRDSLITSYQALPFAPELAANSLRTLALIQGTVVDPFRDEEPGKIAHELRFGEMTAFEERPHSPYYGAADSTTLFLVLLDEYERWSGDRALVMELERVARAAVNWIDAYGDRDGDGFIEYERRNAKTGLENQCWKDSGDSIVFADGQLAPLPRATCELQGYAYDAKIRTARLAREFWNDPAWAERLEQEAAQLRRRFHEKFWIPERKFYALALDGKKRKVDSLTSNIGHLLWSGIAEKEAAEQCVHHLMSDAMFSGWGVRTMATTEGSYNPIGYHVGTTWPHDTSIIAAGLRRYGYHREAAMLAGAVFDAAALSHNRLPEAYAGYARDVTHYPVEYPTACSPQAWAAGAPLLLLRVILGLEPYGDHLVTDASVPAQVGRLELLDIPGRWGHADALGRAMLEH